jgi:uncharacterized protein YjbI with pentapeptide repeats
MCDLSKANLAAKTLSGALMSDANFAGANMQEVVLSKAYAGASGRAAMFHWMPVSASS